MSTAPKRYQATNWSVTIVPKPWYVDVMTFGLIAVWMGWTFTTMQTHGPSPWLLASAVSVALIGVLAIYGQRLRHLKIGDWFELGMRTPEDYDGDPLDEDREKNR